MTIALDLSKLVVGFDDEAFGASANVAAIAAPAAEHRLVIVEWSLTLTAHAGIAKLKLRDGAAGSYYSGTGVASGIIWTVPQARIFLTAATALYLSGGAASAVLNGHIRYDVI